MQIKTIQSVHYCMLYQCTLYSILYIRSFIYLLFISFSKQLNFVWGEKQNTHIPPPSWSHDWLAAGGGSWPHPLTHTNAVRIYQPKKWPMSKAFYHSFYPQGWVGWAKILFQLENSGDSWIPGMPECPVCHFTGFFECRLYMLDLEFR